MSVTTKKERVGDRLITTTVTDEDCRIHWDDIEGRAESDNWNSDPPWMECDGWEHEWRGTGYYDDDRAYQHYSYVNRSACGGGCGFIDIDDETVIGWGCTGPSGCSKQVRFESIQRAKRKATEQLVKWYTDGWYISAAFAEYGDYSDSVGGIHDEPWGDYTAECIDDCRREVAAQLEADGYEVVGVPEQVNPYSRLNSFKERIKRNLNPYA